MDDNVTDDSQPPDGKNNILARNEESDLQKSDLSFSSNTKSPGNQAVNADAESPSYHKNSSYSFRRNFKKVIIFFIFIFLAATFFVFFGRSFVDSILQRIDSAKTVHRDVSKIDSGVIQQVKPKVILVYRQKNGQLERVLADEEAVSEFSRESINLLEMEKLEIRNSIRKKVHDSTDATFAKMREQIIPYADWYFAWSTTYKILGEAIASATNHAMKPEAVSLKEAVTADVEKYLRNYFEKIVLRPEISDSELKMSFKSSLQDTHKGFLLSMSKLDQRFQKFAAKQTNLLEPVDTNKARVELDWDSQFDKKTTAGHEKGAGGVLVGSGLVTGGAVFGKTLASAAGKASVGKFMSGAALKGLTAKLATPFVTKAVSLTAATATGAAAGTVAGPVGTAIGAVAGVGLDYSVSKGVELVERDSFIADTSVAVNAIQREWENGMTMSLEEAVDHWFDDLINLLSGYSKIKG